MPESPEEKRARLKREREAVTATNPTASTTSTVSGQGTAKSFIPYQGDKTGSKGPDGTWREPGWNKTGMSVEEMQKLAQQKGYTGPADNKKLQEWMLTKPEMAAVVKKNHEKYGTPKAGIETDGHFGIRWADALKELPDALQENPVVTEEIPVAEKTAGAPTATYPPKTPDAIKNYNQDDITPYAPEPGMGAPWWLQDKINLAGSAINYFDRQKYMPWDAPVNYNIPDPTFYDDKRAVANINEQYQGAIDGLAQLSDPQSYTANATKLMGEAGNQAANVIADYQNRNVGVANQFATQNSALLNQEQITNNQKAKQLYDHSVIANQQWDNSSRDARNKVLSQFVNGITNSKMTGVFNEMQDNFTMNPRWGGDIYKRSDKDLRNTGPEASFQDKMKAILADKDLLIGVPDAQKGELAYKIATQGMDKPKSNRNYDPAAIESIMAMMAGMRG
jgi:hypothetical protein